MCIGIALTCVFCCILLALLYEFTAQKNNSRGISDINLHLCGTKRDDEIDSYHTEGPRNTESKSTRSNSGRQTSRKAEFDYGNKSSLKKKYGLANQMKMQGMLDDCDKGISTSNNTGKFGIFTLYRSLILWVA